MGVRTNNRTAYAGDAPNEEQWTAIVGNDAAYNDSFRYAVMTTGIFCRPSCKSRAPKRENVRIFADSEPALEAGYRPCKRCRPTDRKLPDAEWVGQMTDFIDRCYYEPITLDRLAELYRGSPYHLHRIFKRIAGVTPVEYVQRTRIARAIELLETTGMPMAEIADAVGFGSMPYFITVFKQRTGTTPSEFRRLGRRPAYGEVSE
ncbi:bifunctional transcriptional activator/DNA repair enzyme AdaA [Cohnella rhizosphaerae]|uniref:Helix-turn-helix domain-containing protein n=1 Tax=Cohnella rhizosphaerae TaxID=1457232 RepID=A0A9X4QRL9_9BACL|nr:Ada metal-binding domain-containing protein [Cohnella rhizosphaerae]MDG0808379.1 helix-turn-helix domain-containing protein [Cohnella rhizosphaerae]